MNILEYLEENAKKFPDSIAIKQKREINFKNLFDEGLSFGKALEKKGIFKGDKVLVFVPLSIDLYIALIGIWSIGAEASFVDFSRGADFINDAIKRLNPKIIVVDRITTLARKKEIRKVPQIFVKERAFSDGKFAKVSSDDGAILTFTSGTTGVPKVAVRSHSFLVSQYKALTESLDFSKNHIDFATLAVFSLANLAAGLKTILPNKSYLSKVNHKKSAYIIDREKVSRIICSPALFEGMQKFSKLSSIKDIYLGGGPVYPSLLDKIDKKSSINIVYGSTEAEPISHFHWNEINEKQRQMIKDGFGIPVGIPVKEINLKLVDDEILVSGDTVLKGYMDGIGDKENKVYDGDLVFHKTGDAGRFDEDGILWLLGRISDKVDDFYPFQVECMLNARFLIRSLVVLHKNEKTLIVTKEARQSDDELLQCIEKFSVKKVIRIDKFPMDKRHGAKIETHRLLKILEDL